jgi:hypothetical protein
LKSPAIPPLVVGLALVSAVGCIVACGSYSTRGAGNAFVGSWSCPSLPAGAQAFAITQSADDSLTLAADSDAGSPFCASDLWTYSGSSATMKPGTSCLGGAGGTQVLTFQSFVLTVTGSTMTVSGSESVGGPGKTSQSVTLSSSCKKQ